MNVFSLIAQTAPTTTLPQLDAEASPAQTQVTSLASGGKNVDAVATDFEAVFLSQMMESMFSGDDVSQYFGGGTAGEVYKSFLLNEYGKAMAKAGGIGIAAQVKKELLKLQEYAA
jgi:Rod binding domain-containing protein